ncbi:PAS domain-containing sensor histidine kinase [Microcoleus sp. FACHB-68]|uniref:PAS domain-containing sensor histidine kinase n=1 Tax=Microcoleus sp. FACHB-68 TaxID=2692826 RepID=UPI001684B82A|nr:PAS domain-containing sensor histidine kinase [Microcoleus sp. FACHB-68]MBD1937511.1 PAS domain-containing sensor histidine kinase [Microcoleus sp. FACHB-68]
MSLKVELLEPHVTEFESRLLSSRELAEQMPTPTEVMYRSFVENAVVGMFQATTSGRFLMANLALTRICGYEMPAEMTACAINLKALLYVASGRHTELIHLLQHQANVYKFESQIYRLDGSKIWICENLRAIFDANGKMLGYEGTVEDITERKQAEVSLQDALQKEKALKNHFVSMVSHEFRASLTLIAAASSLLKLHSQKMTSDLRQKYFNKISEVINNTVELIEGFITISKAEVGTLKINKSPLLLPKLCKEVWQDVQIITETNHRLIFSNNCPWDTVIADKTLLRQILLNLFLNAVKYSPEASSISLELAGIKGKIMIRIKDQGVGIPLEDREHLFELFHRAQNASACAGTGLGLAIVKQAVELHGGNISVESEVGVGTTFTVTLPVLPDSNC